VSELDNCTPSSAITSVQKQNCNVTVPIGKVNVKCKSKSRLIVPPGSEIYLSSNFSIRMDKMSSSDKLDLADHIFVPSKSEVRTFVFLEDPTPRLVPLELAGIVERRPKHKSKKRFDDKGWLLGCNRCCRHKSLCEDCVQYYASEEVPPAPRLVCIETNPGEIDFRFIFRVAEVWRGLMRVHNFDDSPTLAFLRSMRIVVRKELAIFDMNRDYNDFSYLLDLDEPDAAFEAISGYLFTPKPLHPLDWIPVLYMGRVYLEAELGFELTLEPDHFLMWLHVAAPACRVQLFHLYRGIVIRNQDLFEHFLMSWYFRSDPFMPLTGDGCVESNPGPEPFASLIKRVDPHIFDKIADYVGYDYLYRTCDDTPNGCELCMRWRHQYVAAQAALEVTLRRPRYFQADHALLYLDAQRFNDRLIDWEYLHSDDAFEQRELDHGLHVLIKLYWGSGVPGYVTDDLRVTFEDRRFFEDSYNWRGVPYVNLFVESLIEPLPPIPILQLDEEHLVSTISSYLWKQDMPSLTGNWGDDDQLEEDIAVFKEHNRIAVALYDNFGPPEYHAHANNLISSVLGAVSGVVTDPIGVEAASRNISEAVNSATESITGDGIKHVHTVSDELMQLLRKIGDTIDSYSNVDFSTFIKKAIAYIPGVESLLELWENSVHPKSKLIAAHVIISSMSALAVKYELDWRGRLTILAVQIGIACYHGDSSLKKAIAMIYGVEATARVMLQLPLLIQTWLSDPDGDYEAHANPLLDQLTCSAKHVVPVFAKSVIAVVAGSTFDGDVKSFLDSCSLYKKLINGFEFTISSLVDLMRAIFDMFGSNAGFNLFKNAYSNFPSLYTISDYFDELREVIHTGKKVDTEHLEKFKMHSKELQRVTKLVGVKSENVVYQTQVRVLGVVQSTIQKALSCLGLYSNNFRCRPLPVTLLGPSGIGKTPLMRLIANCLAGIVLGEDVLEDYQLHPESYCHFWAESAEFHDNMLPNTPILFWDDWAQTKKSSTPETCPGRQLVPMNNNSPEPVNCASEPRKNTVFFEMLLMILSSNRNAINPDDFHCYDVHAIINRLGIIIKVEINPEFRRTTGADVEVNWGYTLDKSKLDPDKLNIHVYNFVLYDIRTRRDIQSFQWDEFIPWLAKRYIEHRENEISRMNQLAASMRDPELNPIHGMSVSDIKAHADLDLTDPKFARYMEQAAREYKEKELYAQETFDALSPVFQAKFGFRPSDPHDVYWYFSIADGMFWTQIYSTDPGWASFMDEHMRTLYSWMDGNIQEKYIKTLVWKVFSPTEIPHDVKVLCSLARLYYIRARNITYRLGLTYLDVWNALRKLPPHEALHMAEKSVVDLIYIEYRESMHLLTDTYQGVFNFTGFWMKHLLLQLPAIITSLYAFEKVIAHSNVRLRKTTRARKPFTVKPITVQHVAESAEPDGFAPHSAILNKMAMQAAICIHTHNEYGIFFVGLDGKLKFAQSLLFLGGRKAVTTTHFAKALQYMVRAEPNLVVKLYSYYAKTFIDVLARYVKVSPAGLMDKSILLFHKLSGVHPHKSIVKYLADDSLRVEEGTNLLLSLSIIEDSDPTKFTRYVKDVPIVDMTHKEYCGEVGDVYRYRTITIKFASQVGYCGALAFVSDTRYSATWQAIGLLAAGHVSAGTAILTPMTRQWAETALAKGDEWSGPVLDDPLVIQDVFACSALPPKFRVASTGPVCSQSNYTKKKENKLSGLFGGEVRCPSNLTPFTVEGSDDIIDPPYMARDKYCSSVNVYNPFLMVAAVTMYLTTLMRILFNNEHPPPYELTPEEAIVGNADVEPIPRNTSVGYAYQLKKITKAMLFGVSEVYDMTTSYCVDLISNVKVNLKKMGDGVVVRHVAKDFFKDQVIEENKALSGKARMVSGVDVEDLVEEKCCFGYAVARITENPIYSGTAVGLNPYSEQWHQAYMTFSVYHIIAGDFKNWDGIVFNNIAYAVLEVLFRMIYYNATPEQHTRRYTMLEGMATSLHAACFAILTIIYWWISGLSSGRFITLVGNSMYNNVLLRYVFLMCYLATLDLTHLDYSETMILPLTELESKIRVMTLGDDHIFGFDKSIDYVTHTKFVDYFKQLGITYTDEKKGEGPVADVRTMDDISFEQRTWRWSEELQRYVAPLNFDSILNAIYWCEEKDLKQVCQSMVDEISFHGEEVYSDYVPRIVSALIKYYGIYLERTDWKQSLYFISAAEQYMC